MMTQITWLYPTILVMSGIYAFTSNRKHLLSMLLSLEITVLGLYMILFLFLSSFSFEMSVSLMFLSFSVCEGALGLSVLVSLVRTHGNDYFQSFNVI